MTDVAIMLDIMIGADPLDNLTLEAVPYYPKEGYLAEVVGKDSLKGMKLGMPWYYWNASAVSSTLLLEYQSTNLESSLSIHLDSGSCTKAELPS
jgi:Asp-tRNA(Asn)/Glu-tRNA(Gln) amidotransferase A subunit family amidase